MTIVPQRQALLDGEACAAMGDETVRMGMREEELDPDDCDVSDFEVKRRTLDSQTRTNKIYLVTTKTYLVTMLKPRGVDRYTCIAKRRG